MNSPPSKNFTLKPWQMTAIIIFIGLWIIRDPVLRLCVQPAISKMVGARTTIGKLSLSLVFQKIRIKNLTIYNPPGFPKEPLLVMPEIAVQYNLPKALKGIFYFPLILIDLKEMIVIRNAEGKLNVDSLKIVQETLHPTQPAPEINFKIDTLKLNVERIIFKDSYKKPSAVIKVYNIDLKQKVLTDIDSPGKLATSVIFEAIKPTALRKVGMWAATSLAGVGFLPAAALGIIVAKDDATAEVKISINKVFAEASKLAKEAGTVKNIDKDKKQIQAKIYDCDVIITVEKSEKGKTLLRVKARKHLLAQSKIAAGILYQLMERLGQK